MADTKTKTTKDLFKKEFIEEMKDRLLVMRSELQKKLGITAAESDEARGTFPDYGDEEDDNVHEIEGYMVNENLKMQDEKDLRDVEVALKRIEDGTYGICKYTGAKIDEKRLRIRPTSSASVQAKEGFQPKKKE